MKQFKQSRKLIILALIFTCTAFFSSAQKYATPPIMQANWSQDYEPFRIVGNLYYVGTYDLASYLIVTPKGNILINTGLAESVPMIKTHIEKLGFKFSDIKILLATHAHYDHVAGMAEIKKLTGATLMINENDAGVMADGGNSDYAIGGKGAMFEPVKVDRLLHEQDTIKFGGMQIIPLHHPGHTKGATSFLFDVKDDNRTYRVLIANMPTILDQTNLAGMPTYPDVAKDYARTLENMKKVNFDIWLASHAAQCNLHTKHKPGDAYRPEAFSDRAGYDAAIDKFQKDYNRRLANK